MTTIIATITTTIHTTITTTLLLFVAIVGLSSVTVGSVYITQY